MKKNLRYFMTLLLMMVASVGWSEEVSIILSEQGYENGQEVSSTTSTSGDVTLTYNKGTSSTAPAYYNTGTGVRVYAGGNLTVTASGNTITKVVVTYAKNNSPKVSGTPEGWKKTDSPATWEGSATEVVLNVKNSGHIRIQKVVVTYETSSTTPFIIANNVNIDYDATSGEIAYTISNPVTGTSLTADVSEGSWLTLGTVSETSIPFTCSANEGAERTATVTLTYGDITEDVTITQAAKPAVYTTIPAILDAATSNSTPVTITFGNWVVSGVNGGQVFVTDGINGFIIYQSGHGFEVGNTLSGTASCNLVLFNGSAELTGLTSKSEGLTVGENGSITPVNTTIGELSAVNTGSVVTLSNLTYDGTTLSDGTNTINLNNRWYTPELVSGGEYNITGVFHLNNTNKLILPRSDEDIEVLSVPSSDAYAELPFSWDGGASAALVHLDGVTADGLGTDYAESNAPYRVKFDNTGDFIQVKTNERPGVVTIGVKMLGGANESSIIVQESVDGKNFDNLEILTISGKQNTELSLNTTEEFAEGSRYVRLYFTKGSNVGVGPISISKYATINFSIAEACTDGTSYFGTFYTDKPYVMPKGVTGQTVAVDDAGKLEVNDAYAAGSVVPAETPLLMKATAAGEKTALVTTGREASTFTNMLKGTLTADQMTEGGDKYYRLTMHNGTTLGFYWGAENGGAFKPGANKAYLAVPASTPAKEGFAFGETTGINNVNANENESGKIFNLAGQQMKSAVKGIYIKNGKKYIK